ncbi:MAG: hypothetical protein KAT48_14530 [Bacteroidales bacterium]|nr:hypothetical protein [Bacteroidales bacterium]
MKRILLSFAFFGLLVMIAFAQAPQAFKYQAIARDHDGNILSNQQISVEVKLVQGSNREVAVYSEQHFTTTNDFGLINLTIGQGVERTGDFRNIDWGSDSYLVEIALDESGGTDFEVMGTAQLLSVPYALYAEEAGSDSRENDLDWGKRLNDKLDVYTGTGNGYPDGNVGIGTFIPEGKLHIKHAYGFSSVFRRVNNYWASNALFLLQRTRGSGNVLSPVQEGDRVGQIRFEGYHGITGGNSLYGYPSIIISQVAGPLQNDIVPGNLQFWTTDTLGNLGERFRISGAGYLGIGTLTPSSMLHVNGDFRLLQGTSVYEISIDSLLTDQSDDAVVTEKAIKWYVDHTVPGQDYLYHNVLIRFDSLQKQVVNSTVFDEDLYVHVQNNLIVDGYMDVAGAVDLAASGVLTNVRGSLSVDEAAVFDSTVDVSGSTRLHGTLDVDGIARFLATVNSTTKDNGAVVVENGGLGVEQQITSGTDIWAYHTLISGNSITIDGTLDPGTIEESHGKISFVDDTIHTDGAIGVGTLFPKAEIHVTKDNGVVAEGTFGSGTLGVEGAGVRMLWYPKKAAFRAGYANDTSMNDAYIGEYSAAFGNQSIAIGSHSVAGGLMTVADRFAVAFGNNTQANGRGSVAMGDHTTADGDYSTAFGKYSEASGNYSFAMGEQDTASAPHSVAFGYKTKADDNTAFALGQWTYASGDAAFAGGSYSAALGDYSFAFGESDTASASNTVAMGIRNNATASAAVALGSYNTAGGTSSFAGGNHSAATGGAAFAFGEYDTASNNYAIAMGRNNKATASQAVALGGYNIASGISSFAGGNHSAATAGTAFAFGEYDTASNTYAVAFGYKSKASGSAAFAEGSGAVASGNYSVAMGDAVTASGGSSVAFGWGTEAHGTCSFAFGKDTYANGSRSFAGGEVSLANGNHSFAMGDRDTTLAPNSFALGFHTKTNSGAHAAFALGYLSTANGVASIAAGYKTYAGGNYSFAMGYQDTASSERSVAFGFQTKATAADAFAIGYQTRSAGIASFAGGINSHAGGNYSFAMGQKDTASAPRSVAFGFETKATNDDAFAMGYQTIAGGDASLAAGYNSHAIANYSRAMGHSDTARGTYATAIGQGINARSINVTSIGRFNLGNGSMANWNATDPIFEIGIGTNNANRLNAMTVYKNGSATMMGPVTITDATESTSSLTGALIVAGGIGAGKNINAGGTITSGSSITMDGTYNPTSWASTLHDTHNRIHFLDDTLTTMGWMGLGTTQPIGQLDVNGWTHLDQTSIVTNDGPFFVSGNNGVLFAINDSIWFVAQDYSKFVTDDTLELCGQAATIICESGLMTTIRGNLTLKGYGFFEDSLDVDGHTTLDQVSINTSDGEFSVSGPNNVNFDVTGAIILKADDPSEFTCLEQLTLGGDTTYLGGVVITQNTTNAVTYNNAPLMVTGGAGFAKDVYMNQKLDAQGPVYLGTFGNTTTVRGFLSVVQDLASVNMHASGNLTVVGSSLLQGVVSLNSPTDIIVGNFSTGALLIPYGGVSIGGSLQVKGGLFGQLGNSSNCLSAYIDSINLCGALPLVVTGSGGLKVRSTTASTSTTTGALVVAGGAGIGGDLWVGGTINGNVSGSLMGDVGSPGNCYTGYLDTVIGCSPIVFNADKFIFKNNIETSGNLKLDSSPATGSSSGTIAEGAIDAGVSPVFGSALFVASDGDYELADADAASTMPCIALALGTGTGTQDLLFHGFITNSSWSWTVGGEIYVSTTAGGLTQTAPSGSGDEVQIIGVAISATTILFDPDWTIVTIAAF